MTKSKEEISEELRKCADLVWEAANQLQTRETMKILSSKLHSLAAEVKALKENQHRTKPTDGCSICGTHDGEVCDAGLHE